MPRKGDKGGDLEEAASADLEEAVSAGSHVVLESFVDGVTNRHYSVGEVVDLEASRAAYLEGRGIVAALAPSIDL